MSQGSQSLALGLAKTAATHLDEFVRSPGFLGKAAQNGIYWSRIRKTIVSRRVVAWARIAELLSRYEDCGSGRVQDKRLSRSDVRRLGELLSQPAFARRPKTKSPENALAEC